uniref:CUB domain-containing protein n=1 Tax=Ciona savignyi TaxID=51511 RepID=H2YKV4_CIOSA
GVIQSPYYPLQYPANKDCYYTIRQQPGHVITLIFNDVDIEVHDDCAFDYIEVFDGPTQGYPSFGRNCGSTLPAPIESRTNQLFGAMLVWFHSDWGIDGRGFFMTWTVVIGGGIEPNPTNVPTIEPGACGSEQMVAAVYPIYFTSPGWPGLYPNNLNCVWIIEAAPNHRVAFKFIFLDIESINSCSFDYMKLFNGPTIASPLIGRFCGKQTPSNIVYSTSNYLTVQMVSDGSVGTQGFNASYQQACGGILIGDSGAVTSPNYPNDYPPNTFCQWEVFSTIGSNISLSFDQDFNIQNTDDMCSANTGDYIELLNGLYDDSPPLNPNNMDGNGRYCGSTTPPNLATLSNGMLIRFQSNDQVSGIGFRLTYSAQDGSCGSRLVLSDEFPMNTFTSPNYPNAYPMSIDCYWILTAPTNEAIQLDFKDFAIESHSQCEKDYVLVMEGHTGDGEILGKFCGTDQPSTTKSSGNEMTVRFRSDSSTQNRGFEAIYKIASCGGTLVGVGGTITSPNYPFNYPEAVSCQWVVRGPAYHFISFVFDDLDLDTTTSCGDYLAVRSYNFTGPIIATVCGRSAPDVIESETNEVYITFVSDAVNTSLGFSLTYTASEDACGAELTTPGGVLTSPNYPNVYDHARVCTWNIVVADSRSVTLTFNNFAVEDPHTNGYCYWDYVEVYNGINPNSPSIRGRMCGSNLPDPVQSSGNTMKVVFKTDASVGNGGFLATYDSFQDRVCGGRLSLNAGNLTSPNFPNNYENSMECVWIIENTNLHNSTILVSFEDFALEQHVTCDRDYLSFKAGSTYDSYPVANLCGQTIPEPVGVALQEIFVQFVSDSTTVDRGFFAKYQFTGCGGLVVGTTNGVITSPNYPAVYNNHDYCLWTIAVPEGRQINLRWTNFTIELHSSCRFDYLKLYNGPTTDSPLIDTYCGTNEPTEFQSGGNTVTILFQSDFSVTHGGWRMEWKEHATGCGNIIYHGMSGSFASPKYPDLYPPNSDCVWQIIVDPAFHVGINFDDFEIEQHDGCFFDYVALYDGAVDASTQIQRFCGTGDDVAVPGDSTYESPMQIMLVRFASDFSQQKKGFHANWQALCGQLLTKESGTIQSANLSGTIPEQSTVKLIMRPNKYFDTCLFRFLSFDVESGSKPSLCDYDAIKVYAGNSTAAHFLGMFCNNLPPIQPLSSEGSMLIAFETDALTVGYGFQASYESSDCGGFLTASSGLRNINAFTHSDVHNRRNCTWQIRVSPPQKIIELVFSSFDLETHGNCDFDYVKVYDGINTHARLIGTYCGTRTLPYILSSSNKLTIEYVTDDLFTGDGFTSSYRATTGPLEGCGGIVSAQSGVIQSVDLDNSGNYDANLNCLWIINGGLNTVVRLSFNYFHLENGSNFDVCNYDRIEIRDGSSDLDPLVMSVCGNSIPAPFTSSTNTLLVRFISDFSIEDIGFSANFTAVNQTCGGLYDATNDVHLLSSPSLNGLNAALNCRWTIDAGTDPSRFIQIVFDSFEIMTSSSSNGRCTKTYLQLRDYPLDGQSYYYCGSDLPPDFHSLGQIVQINLKSDLSTSGLGFTLRFKSTNCSKMLTQDYGQIFSPGWPDTYGKHLQCETRIDTKSGNPVQFFFNDLNLEN